MNANDDFAFQPPEYQNQNMGRANFPHSGHEAWMLQLIQTRLNDLDVDDKFKKQFVNEISYIIDGAGMTHLRRGEVQLFLGIFEELWMKFMIFKCERKHYKALNYMKTFILNLLLQKYNCSIDGWQGDHVWEQKTTYNVSQTSNDMSHQSQPSYWERRRMKKMAKKNPANVSYEVVPQ